MKPYSIQRLSGPNRLRALILAALCGMFWQSSLSVAVAQKADATAPTKRKLLLLAQGPDGHPATTHEYDAGIRLLDKILSRVPNIEVEILRADGAWEQGPDKLRQADGALLFLSEGAKWIHEEPRRLEAFAQMAARGGGLSTLHWGMGTKEPQYIEGFVKLFGGCHGGPDRMYKVLEADMEPIPETHEIVNGIGPFRVYDELYYRLKFVDAKQNIKPILTAKIDGHNETVAWAWDRGDGGRSFGFSGAHFHRNWEMPEYRRLVAQGILWTLKQALPKDGINVDVTSDDLKLPAAPPQ